MTRTQKILVLALPIFRSSCEKIRAVTGLGERIRRELAAQLGGDGRAYLALELVGHEVVGGAEVLLWRVRAETRDATSVDVGVQIDLQAEAAHLALLFQQ
jgi:hypothetical protein